MNIKMRLMPENYTYTKTFHVLFSTLCKSVQRSAGFYTELAKVRSWIKIESIEKVLEAIGDQKVFSNVATDYFKRMKNELPKVGTELQSRTLTYLLALRDEDEDKSVTIKTELMARGTTNGS